MASDDAIKAEGEVVESLRNATFKVKLANGHVVTAYPAGKLVLGRIRIFVGDKVTLEMSPYDLTRGRIVWRTNTRKPSSADSNGDEIEE
ncbi:MAG: translation initiation factor IF-1 [Clostridia bacterium]|nr:translation initiation factor IF-1 [Clostridia bacterium]